MMQNSRGLWRHYAYVLLLHLLSQGPFLYLSLPLSRVSPSLSFIVALLSHSPTHYCSGWSRIINFRIMPMQRFSSSSSFCGVNRKGAKKHRWTTKTVLNTCSLRLFNISKLFWFRNGFWSDWCISACVSNFVF